MDSNTTEESPDSRRSWLVATLGAVGMVFTFGTPTSYGILRRPLSEAFNISPVALSTVFSVMLFTFFIGSGLVGAFAAQVPSRRVILAAAAVSGLIAPSLYVVESFGSLLVVFGLLGLALGTVFVLLASVVPRWFDRRRGTATGLIFVGNGLGLFLLPPIWQFAISSFGIRRAFLLIMSVTALTFFTAGLVCRRPAWASRMTTTTDELLGWIWGLARLRSFQAMFVGMGLAFAWYQLLAGYAVDLFAARGLTESAAPVAFGLVGGVSIISRIGGGYVGDTLGARRTFLLSLGCVILGIGLLFAPQLPLFGLGIFWIGIGLGGCATLYIPLLMELYTPEKDTAVVGIFNISAGIGALAMPPLGAASVARTGGYSVAILLTLGCSVAAFGLILYGTSSYDRR
ncbi:MAG: MFS transporter [Natronomonas sp.]